MPKPQPEPNDLTELIHGLEDLSQESVLEAANTLPGLFLKAAEYRVQKMRRLSEAEMALDATSAEVELKLRSTGTTANGDKITENYVKAFVAGSSKVQAANKVYHDREAQGEYAKLLLEAYRIKRDCLRAVTDLTSAERAMEKFLQMNQAALSKARDKVNSKYAQGGE